MDIAFLANDAAQAIYGSRTYATALAYKLPTIPIHLPSLRSGVSPRTPRLLFTELTFQFIRWRVFWYISI